MNRTQAHPPAVASAASEPAPRPRYAGGWRAGKPAEDPEKLKRWGRITARPSEYLIHMRRGRVRGASSGQGASCVKWPSDAVAIVPTTIQRLHFVADQVTAEKVGVQVSGLAVWRIADPLTAFRMLNFSFPERASEKLEQMLSEMFVGAVRRLVANLSLEDCLTRRKEGLAIELMREIAPVVSGRGRTGDQTDQGWGVILDTIEIQDVRVSSPTVFANLQAPFRQAHERSAREAELETQRAVKQQQVEVERQVALARLESERAIAAARQQAELERTRLEDEAAAARHAAGLASTERERALARAQADTLAARRALGEAELRLAELEAARSRLGQELDLARARAEREIENAVSPARIQLALAQQLPALAAAFQQQFGPIHITAVDGANPFGIIAAAIEAVLGLARAAGLPLGEKKPPE